MFATKKGLVKKTHTHGRVYVFKFTLDDGTILHKVGMCHSPRSIDRMFEVLRGFFTVFRYSPKCELRKDKKVLVPHLVEKHLHYLLEEMSYSFDKKFDGSTEFFSDIDEEALLDYLDTFQYIDLLEGKTKMKSTDLTAIYAAIDSEKPRKEKDLDVIPF